MADYEALGQQFCSGYYAQYDANRATVEPFYCDESMYSFEGKSMQGKAAIMKHITEDLRFQVVQHAPTAIDCQPAYDGSVVIQVMGQLKTDDDPPHGFAQTFVLRQPQPGAWFIYHDIFRLVLHNG